MLSDLLEEELSEARLGLSTGARAHLNRFRAYIHGFYTTKFGSFPPPAADPKCSTILRSEVYCTMKADFEALYQYLVDETFTTTDNSPSVAQGGLCALQSVHEFDLRHNFTPLDHPLPLLPELVKAKESRRRRSMPWFTGNVRSREGRLHPDQRPVVHAALMRATNDANIDLLDNRLVLAYREFEQDSIMIQHKGERSEKAGLTPGDARKVRWLFIYAMYQTLRSCTETPVEVRHTSQVPYNLGVSVKGLPPWQTQDVLRPATSYSNESIYTLRPRVPERGQSIGAVPLLSPMVSPAPTACGGFELKPDIDYFALTHQDENAKSQRGRSVSGNNGITTPRSRSQSLTRNISLRRSLSVFRPSAQRCATLNLVSPSRTGRKTMYHEIVVHGYGNGTNSITEEQTPTPPQLTVGNTASRSASTSSTSSYASAHSSLPSTTAQSLASTTLTMPIDPQSPTSSSRQTSESWMSTNTLVGQPSYETLNLPALRQVSTGKCVKAMYSNDDMLAAAKRSEPPPLPRRSSKRFTRGTAAKTKRWSLVNMSAELRGDASGSEGGDDVALQPSPLRIRKASTCAEDDVFWDHGDWAGSGSTLSLDKVDVSPPCAWEQFTDLGGLQPVHLLS